VGKKKVNHNDDRYAEIIEVVARVLEEKSFPQYPVERLEVTCLASGEATWRAWPAKAEESEGGYYPAGEHLAL
jgi:hypothetical protein